MTFLIVLVVLVVLLIMIGGIFAAKIIFPKCFGFEETYRIEVEKGRIDPAQYHAWVKEEVRIPTDYGYTLNAQFFPSPGSKRGVILSHGVTYTLFGSVKYMPIFRELGFNILVYDLRYHGRSGGKNCTFGFYEQHDLARVMDWMEQKIGPGAVIGTHGESMGAAITLLHAAIDPRVAFVVEDCGFSDLQELLTYRLKEDFHIGPFPVMPLASWISRLLTGMSFDWVSPLQTVGKISAPVLFIHGAEDDYIPPKMAEDLYRQKTNGPRSLYLAPNSKHAQSFWNNREEYAETVTRFLKENHILESTIEEKHD